MILSLMIMIFACCSPDDEINMGTSENSQIQEEANNSTMVEKIYITIDEKTQSITLVENVATKALVKALQESSITYEASDYGNFEKVGALGKTLPTNNTQITTSPGDVILYNANQIVIFYGTNSWSYTRLGKIDILTGDNLKTFLKAGEGTVKITLSVNDPSKKNE